VFYWPYNGYNGTKILWSHRYTTRRYAVTEQLDGILWHSTPSPWAQSDSALPSTQWTGTNFAFVDDLLSLASRREELQDETDIMSTAAAILGILFAILKLRTSAENWGQEPSGHQKTDYPGGTCSRMVTCWSSSWVRYTRKWRPIFPLPRGSDGQQ